jgi:hypothetical protein
MAVAGCMALAALGAMAVLDIGSPTAEAAPSVSSFAGTYVWGDWPVPITISDGGQISSSYSYSGSRAKGSINGQVSADGSYSFTESVTTFSLSEYYHGSGWVTGHWKHAGLMAPDLAGNIVATDRLDTNGFAWLRQ